MELKHLTINPEIIKEFPRFFTGGFHSVAKEILQNCYRSGATEVIVQYDLDTGYLKVVDNGHGCKADDILSAGDSGWDNESFDPAGLGIFSYFSISKKIIMISHGQHNWKLGLDDQHLNHNKEVTIEDIQSVVGRTGFSLELNLFQDDKGNYPFPEFIKKAFSDSKAYYPFKLDWDSGDGNLEELVYSTWEPSLVIDSQVGVIQIKRDICGHEHSIVHQYVPIRSAILEQALQTYCDQHQDGDLLFHILGYVKFRLFPIIEVKPKLPDRIEFDSTSIEQIVPKIMEAVLCELDKLSPVSNTWPDIFSNYQHYRLMRKSAPLDKLLNAFHSQDFCNSLLPHFGYTRIDYGEFVEPINCYEEDNDLRLDSTHNIVFIRNKIVLESPNQSVVDTVNNLGYFCKLNYDAPTILKLKGIHIPDENKHIGFAEEIYIAGIGEIPYLYTVNSKINENPEIGNISILINPMLLSPEYLKENLTIFRNMAILGEDEYNGSLYEYQRESYGELELDTTKIDAELMSDYYRNNEELLAIVSNQYAIEAAMFELDNICNKISGMKSAPAIGKLFPDLADKLLKIINQSYQQLQNS